MLQLSANVLRSQIPQNTLIKILLFWTKKTQNRNTFSFNQYNQPGKQKENNNSESISDYQVDTNETQLKTPKLENRIHIHNSFRPLFIFTNFLSLSYPLSNMYPPFNNDNQSRHPFNYLQHLCSQSFTRYAWEVLISPFIQKFHIALKSQIINNQITLIK